MLSGDQIDVTTKIERRQVTKILTSIWRKLIVPTAYINWWDNYRDWRTGDKPGEQTRYRMRSGATLELERIKDDRQRIDEIWLLKSYEPTPDFQIEPNWNVFDIGANRGYFTVYAAQKASRGHVTSFEPLQENVAYLKKNNQINNLKNVTVVPKAVSTTNGTTSFYVSSKSGSHSMVSRSVSKVREIEVETIAIRDVLENLESPIDLLKVDIEGGELDVLTNGGNGISLDKVKRIVLEYHEIDGVSLSDMKERLTSLLNQQGFSVGISPREERILYGLK